MSIKHQRNKDSEITLPVNALIHSFEKIEPYEDKNYIFRTGCYFTFIMYERTYS